MYRDSEIHYSEDDVMLVDEQNVETTHIHSTKNTDVVNRDSRCEHTGDCGSAYHQGNNFCYLCSICNPDNEDAY